ncbi:hypothetical protein LKO27_00510 [Tessaracoccus sp. OS52]|uniref:hypothetical protein n=1 Tax=Tessaracoccus sp. OS52 TaxID=2886691 RepID=UPI001D113DF9|nr:hypothetical protein [Tessaracoccus sp. OS52]MCC2591912.1 hypothetical protein [Tessaracoccus sp. OS52]
MNRRPQLPKELDEALYARLDSARDSIDEGNYEAALAEGDAIWEALPEPKMGWDYYPEIVSQDMCAAAIEAGRLDRAAEWLERTTQAYTPLNPTSELIVDFLKAKLFLRSGNEALAYAYFDAIHQAQGKRPFQDEPPVYWEFYDGARKSGGIDGAAAASVVPPAGEGTPTGADLPDDVHAEVTRLFEEGSNYEDLNAPDAAVECHIKALELLPAPRTQWEAATLVYTALADALGALNRWGEAFDALQLALQSPGGRENGYVWLRLGDAHKADGRTPQALEAYTSAYMLEGEELFEDNPEDLGWLRKEGIA